MTRCEYHVHCAYAPGSPHRDDAAQCPFCHCDFARITAPATRTIESTVLDPPRRGIGPSRPITVTETRWFSGRGELPLQHLAHHVTAERADITAKAEAARKRVAAA